MLLGRAYRSERSDCWPFFGALVGPRPATRLKFGAAWDRSTSMVLALVYSCVRLLRDLVDVRLRSSNPEAEQLLLRHELRVRSRDQAASADRCRPDDIRRLPPLGRTSRIGRMVKPETVLGWHREFGTSKVGSLRAATRRGSTAAGGDCPTADLEDGARESGLGLCPDQRRTARGRSFHFGDASATAPLVRSRRQSFRRQPSTWRRSSANDTAGGEPTRDTRRRRSSPIPGDQQSAKPRRSDLLGVAG